MKLFPDAASRKRFMKTGLPVLLGIAWMPIIGLLIISIIGKPIGALIGLPVTIGITAFMTILFTILLLRFFNRVAQKIKSES